MGETLAGIELRHLRYFIAVAEELNFTRAAECLHTSQPSLSRQIKDLEIIVGGPLLERNKHEVRLTPAGRIFLSEARLTISHFHETIQATRRVMHGEELAVTLGMSPVAELGLFPHMLPRFRVEFPDIQLVLRSLMPTEQVEALRRGRIQVGVFCLPDGAAQEFRTEGMLVHPLFCEPYCIALPDGHWLAARDAVVLEDIADESFIAVSPSKTAVVHDSMISELGNAGVHIKVAHDADNMMIALSMVSLGLGLALMPLCAQTLRRQGVIYRRVAPPLSTPPLSLVASRTCPRKPLAALLAIVEKFRTRPPRPSGELDW